MSEVSQKLTVLEGLKPSSKKISIQERAIKVGDFVVINWYYHRALVCS